MSEIDSPDGAPPAGMRPRSPRRGEGLLFGYACCCGLLLFACAFFFGESFGTHRAPIHVTALVLTAVYALLLRKIAEPAAESLGLKLPAKLRWMGLFLAAGAISGALRFAQFQHFGVGGVELYEREFIKLLHADSWILALLKHSGFVVVLYLAVFIPAVLCCGVIQASFARVGFFGLGLGFQSLAFGYIHCYMTGSFNLVYGWEAFCGAIITGLAFRYLKSLHPPALFITMDILTATLLLAFR